MNILEAIKIHFRLGLIILFIVPTLAWLYALSVTPIFESKARLLIEVKDLGFEDRIERPFRQLSSLSDPIQTQIEVIKSATILDRVIRQFNMRYQSGPQRGQYLSYLTLGQNFRVLADKNVDIVELTFNDPDPKRAKSILQAITDSYIERTIELKASDTSSAIKFLKKERHKAEREALDASKRLKEFEQASKIVNIESNQEIVKTAYSLKAIKLTAETEYARTKTTVDQLSKQLKMDPEEVLLSSAINEDPYLAALRKDLYEKETQLVRLQTKVKPGHYQLEELKGQIEGNKKLIEDRIKELVGDEIVLKPSLYTQDSIRADLIRNLLQSKVAEIAIKEQLEIINDAIAQVGKKLEKIPNVKYIYSQLLRQNEIAQKRLEEIELKLIEAKMRGVIVSHITNIRVIDPPSLSRRPKYPDYYNTLLSSFIFGLFLSLIVVYLVEYFDDVIKNEDTLPKDMPCPLLGQLPTVFIGDLPTVCQEPRSEYSESVHALRTNISFLSVSGTKKLIVVTSAGIGEGKSTIVANLSVSYAQSDKRVLLIDLDIRHPYLYKYLAQPKDLPGVSSLLIDEIEFYDVVQKGILGVVGFDYLPAGCIPPNPVQLLESEKMKELLDTAKHIYDLVIVDTPPICMFSDALLLAPYADVFTIVARANKTSRKELLAIINLVSKAHVEAFGVILNAIPTGARMGYSYTYDYGYYGYSRGDDEARGHSAA